MENNRDINAKARRHLKKYKIAGMIFTICIILLYLLIRLLNNPILNIVTTLLFIFVLLSCKLHEILYSCAQYLCIAKNIRFS